MIQEFEYNDHKSLLTSYTIQTGNLEGISATYNSINQKVTLNNNGKDDDDLFKEKCKSYIINISKKIFLFLSLL